MPTVTSDNGDRFEFPDDMTDAEIGAAMRKHYANDPSVNASQSLRQGAETFKRQYVNHVAEQEYAKEPGVATFMRPVVNGALLGFLPNVIARRNQLMGEPQPDVDTETRREIERRKLELTEQAHPYGSFVGGLAGGAASLATGGEVASVLPVVGRGLATAGRAIESVPTWLGRTLASGAAVGAPVAAVGELGQETPTVTGALQRGAEGAALGGLVNTGLQGAGLGTAALVRGARALGDRYVWPESGGATAGARDVARMFEQARIDPADVARIQQEQLDQGRSPLNMIEAAHEAGELQEPPRSAAAYSILNAARAAAVKGEAGADAASRIAEDTINQPGRIARLLRDENLQSGQTFEGEKARIEHAVTTQAAQDYGRVRAVEQKAVQSGKQDKLGNSIQTVLDDAETRFEDTRSMNTPESGVVNRAISRFKLKQSPTAAQKQADAVSTLGDEVERLTTAANQQYAGLFNSGKMDAAAYKRIAPLKQAADELNDVATKLGSFEGTIPSAMLNRIQNVVKTARNAGVSSDALETAVENLQKTRQEAMQRPKPVRTVQQFIDARRALRDDIVASRNDDGSPSRVTRELRRFYSDLNDAAWKTFPALRTADATHAEARGASDFLDMGRDMALRAGAAQDEALAQFRKATPQQQELIRTGIKQRLADMVANTNYESTATPNKFMANNVQDLLKQTFPHDRAEKLFEGLRREDFKSKVARGMFEGSRTAPMQEQMLQLMLEPRFAAHAVRGNVPGMINMADRILADRFATIRSEQQLQTLMSTEPSTMQRVIDAGSRPDYPSMQNANYIAAPLAARLAEQRESR